MAAPTGNGTEILKYVQVNGLDNGVDTILTVTANHIYTILNVIVANQTNDSVVVGLQFAPGGSGTCIIFADQVLTPTGTYVWNDKFVLTGGDIIKVTCSASDHDVYISYIDQDWSGSN